MNISDLFALFERLAPPELAAGWDNCGVQVAGTRQQAARIAVGLDPTPGLIAEALDWDADVVLTHHPLYLAPTAPSAEGPYLDALRALIPAGAWLYAMHSTLDCRPNGPAFWLGQELGLSSCRLLEPAHAWQPLEVSFYVEEPVEPETGEIWADLDGVYSVGQSASQEVRIVCDERHWPEVARSIEDTLPARTEFFLRRLEKPRREAGFGQVGELAEPLELAALADRVAELARVDSLTLSGPRPNTVRTVAYCTGSGSSLAARAAKAGADVLITGDVKHHAALESPVCLMDVGHFSLEEIMMERLAAELAGLAQGATVRFFPGQSPFTLHLRG